jgi:hypothetical protein
MKIERKGLRIFSYAEEGLISSSNVGEGRMIPTIVLDVEDNQDIIDLLKMHNSIPSGDATMNWIQDFFNRKDFIFKLIFVKPMQIEFGIRFNIAKDFALIDGIIQSKGLYLQTGKKGDKISKKITDDRILIEVPDLGVKDGWNKLFLKALIDKYRKKGFSKKESKEASMQHMTRIRELWKIRRNNK